MEVVSLGMPSALFVELLPAVDSTPIKARMLMCEAASPAEPTSVFCAFLFIRIADTK